MQRFPDKTTYQIDNARSQCLVAYMRNDEAMSGLHRIAERYAYLPRGSLIAEEIVAEVIEEMWAGDVSVPDTSELAPDVAFKVLNKRLMRAVRWRAERVREGKGGWLGRPGPRGPETLAFRDAPDDVLAVEPSTELEQLCDALDPRALGVRIRELAQDDHFATKLLDSFEDDVIKRRAVLQRDAGMTKWHYRRARECLIDYAIMAVREALPADARELLDAAPETVTRVVMRLLGLTNRAKPEL